MKKKKKKTIIEIERKKVKHKFLKYRKSNQYLTKHNLFEQIFMNQHKHNLIGRRHTLLTKHYSWM